LTVAICQLPCRHNVYSNVPLKAIEAIKKAKVQNPHVQLAILPESLMPPYGIEHFSKYAENVPEGSSCQELSKLVQSLGIYIIGGSIIERNASNSYTIPIPYGHPLVNLLANIVRQSSICDHLSPSTHNMIGYIAYGHSMLVDPWARVQRKTGIGHESIIEDIYFSMVDDVRRQLPLFEQRRTDIYNTNLIK
ncbi:hypothetical protein DOY81_008192, partial [Sarcophaga bullata]